jgi:hypothetical protein
MVAVCVRVRVCVGTAVRVEVGSSIGSSHTPRRHWGASGRQSASIEHSRGVRVTVAVDVTVGVDVIDGVSVIDGVWVVVAVSVGVGGGVGGGISIASGSRPTATWNGSTVRVTASMTDTKPSP